MECIIAPGYDAQALKLLLEKKNLRIMEINFDEMQSKGYDVKKIYGGLLFQQKDERKVTLDELKVVTKKKPSPKELESLLFAWKVVKNIKSNAVVMVKGTKAVGIGCGQTSRVESVRTAVRKAGKNAKGSFLASEAFIPKTDNIQLAAKFGIKAIIQTGGSIADEEVIKAADKAKMAMVFTGVRHFKH